MLSAGHSQCFAYGVNPRPLQTCQEFLPKLRGHVGIAKRMVRVENFKVILRCQGCEIAAALHPIQTSKMMVVLLKPAMRGRGVEHRIH